ncbi:hypothetical protein FKM82_003807 [Ascaphus truei]
MLQYVPFFHILPQDGSPQDSQLNRRRCTDRCLPLSSNRFFLSTRHESLLVFQGQIMMAAPLPFLASGASHRT